MFLGQFFVKNAKNDPRTLFERPKSEKKIENRKNAEIAGNGVKNDRFRPSKRQNSDIFKDIPLKLCTRIHLTGLFHIYSGFLKFENFPHFLKIILFVDCFLQFSKFSKFWKSDIAVY